jgi:hypothetical protein
MRAGLRMPQETGRVAKGDIRVMLPRDVRTALQNTCGPLWVSTVPHDAVDVVRAQYEAMAKAGQGDYLLFEFNQHASISCATEPPDHPAVTDAKGIHPADAGRAIEALLNKRPGTQILMSNNWTRQVYPDTPPIDVFDGWPPHIGTVKPCPATGGI